MKTTRKLMHKWDLLLLLVLLLSCGIWLLCQNSGQDPFTAVIYDNGTVLQEIDLSKVEVPYTIPLNSTPAAVFQVEQGRIRYQSAECEDHLCVNAGWLERPGATAACLPGRTMVKVTRGQEDLVMTY